MGVLSPALRQKGAKELFYQRVQAAYRSLLAQVLPRCTAWLLWLWRIVSCWACCWACNIYASVTSPCVLSP